MGWTFTYGQKRAELIAERTAAREWKGKDGVQIKDTVLAHCYRGGVFKGTFYAVHERTHTKGKQVETERWIEVTLMQCHTYPEHGPSWGYKDMEESMGPCEVSCPLGYLEMVPEPKCAPDCPKDGHGHVWARNWRELVRAYHAERGAATAKAKALTKGQIVQLKEGCSPRELVIVSTKPLIGESGGRQYKFKARQLA
jgi:hypothetical protein